MGETSISKKTEQEKTKQLVLLRSPSNMKHRKWKYGLPKTPKKSKQGKKPAQVAEAKDLKIPEMESGDARLLASSGDVTDNRVCSGCSRRRQSRDDDRDDDTGAGPGSRLEGGVSRLEGDRLQWWFCKQCVHAELKTYQCWRDGLTRTHTDVHCTLPTTSTIDMEKHIMEFEERRRVDPSSVQYNHLYSGLGGVTPRSHTVTWLSDSNTSGEKTAISDSKSSGLKPNSVIR